MTIGEAFCGGANHRDLDFDYQRGYMTCPEADEQIKADLESGGAGWGCWEGGFDLWIDFCHGCYVFVLLSFASGASR